MRTITVLFILAGMLAAPGAPFAQNAKPPTGFGFNDPARYTLHPTLMGGAGTAKFVEEFGPSDFKTKHRFLRVGTIPPGASIG